MFELPLQPRFSETDALGHINNAVVPVWFEAARDPLFQIFTPDLDVGKWRLILARLEVDFLAQLHYGHPVQVRTGVAKLGNSSFQVRQEAWQHGAACARGIAVMIHFDYATRKAVPLSSELRSALEQHLWSDPQV